mgnify:CR=1 FL=1
MRECSSKTALTLRKVKFNNGHLANSSSEKETTGVSNTKWAKFGCATIVLIRLSPRNNKRSVANGIPANSGSIIAAHSEETLLASSLK